MIFSVCLLWNLCKIWQEVYFLPAFLLLFFYLVILMFFFKMNSSVCSLLLLTEYLVFHVFSHTFSYLTNMYWLYQSDTILGTTEYTHVFSSTPSLPEGVLHLAFLLKRYPIPSVKGTQTQSLLSCKAFISLWPRWLGYHKPFKILPQV